MNVVFALSRFVQKEKIRAQNAVGTRIENTLKWYVDGNSKKRAHMRWIPILRLPQRIPVNVNLAMRQWWNVKTLHAIAYCLKKPNGKNLRVYFSWYFDFQNIFRLFVGTFRQNCWHSDFYRIKLVQYIFFFFMILLKKRPFHNESYILLLIFRLSSGHQSTYEREKKTVFVVNERRHFRIWFEPDTLHLNESWNLFGCPLFNR